MTLSLSNGGLVLSMRLAEGKLNKRIKTARLNDDQWHKVVVIREAKEVKRTLYPHWGEEPLVSMCCFHHLLPQHTCLAELRFIRVRRK